MTGRAWRALYAVRRAWWRLRGRRGSPHWGITEVNAPIRLPGWVQPGDLFVAYEQGNSDPSEES